jgi:hypothetical protein
MTLSSATVAPVFAALDRLRKSSIEEIQKKTVVMAS